MGVSPRKLVLLLVALHLQCLYTKYYLVKTDGKAASVPRNHKENIKHKSSSKTSKVKPGSAKHKDKKTGRVRREHIGVDYVENQPNPNPGILPTKREKFVLDPDLETFLKDVGLDNYNVKEALRESHISLGILKTMNDDNLKEIGIASYGVRHKLLREIENLEQGLDPELGDFLAAIGLDNADIKEKFVKEYVTFDILKTMDHDHLKKIGITAFGHQHKILTEVKKLKEGKPTQHVQKVLFSYTIKALHVGNISF